MTKTAFMGGTFDPPHLGHLLLAQRAMETLGAKSVRFIPAHRSPLKDTPLTDARHRLAMTRLAIRDNPAFEADTFEIERSDTSYTIDTLRHARELMTGELYWIVGADQLAKLHRWKDIHEALCIATFAVAMRRPYDEALFDAIASYFSAHELRSLQEHRIDMPRIDISSTDIRERVKRGLSIHYMVPDAVQDYILTHSLYRDNE